MRFQYRTLLITWVCFVTLSTRAADPAPEPLAATVKERIGAGLAKAEAGDFAGAKGDLEATFDLVIAHGGEEQIELFRESARARRLVRQLEGVPAERRGELLKYLRENPKLADHLVFAIQPGESAAEVYAMLDRLREKHGKRLDDYATLTAALCVVHDRPLVRRVNENQVKAPDVVALFEYYVANESKLFYGLKNVPVELLVYVVDSTATPEEMSWALEKFEGDRAVGKRFFDVRYDYVHLQQGTPKKVTQAGFTLPNILKYGGVCADQAYFAAGVGKSIGVPSTYVRAASGEVSHAWVGFLESNKKAGWWNFDTGRYEAYRGVKGDVADPQTGEVIADAFVSLLAEGIGTEAEARHNAVALTDAADRLVLAILEAEDFAPPSAPSGVSGEGRGASSEAVLELVELALRQNVAHGPAWLAVRDLATEGKLSLAQKKTWAGHVEKLCGTKYPDFALAVVAPMIETVEEPKEQNRLWNAAFGMFKRRPDLAAEVRVRQAGMWEKAGNPAAAGKCYEEVIGNYANAGPFVIDALEKAEVLLRRNGREGMVPVLYERAWRKTQRPGAMAPEFMKQSNWYRIGTLYAQRLQEAGKGGQADEVLRKIALD